MLADCILVSRRLSRKAQVVRISSTTRRSPQEVVGWLVEFWGWVSDETHDGHLPGMRPEHLTHAVGADTEFWEAVKDAGWLVDAGTALQIPDYDRWLGPEAIKRRRERVRKSEARNGPRSVRDVSANGPRSVRDVSGKAPRGKTRGGGGLKSPGLENPKEEDLRPPPPEAPTPEELLAAWNAVPGFEHAREMTEGRRRSLRARCRSRVWLRDWRGALVKASGLPFCLGQGERRWVANLDWFLRPDTVNKILEGHYDAVRGKAQPDIFAGLKEFAARPEAAHDPP